jgi:hypothetical protein
VISSDNSLQLLTNCYSLTELLRYGILKVTQRSCVKGGHFDCYGLSYSRGGSNRTQALRSNGQANAPRSQNARIQTWWRVANRQGRIRGVETPEQKSVSEARRELVDLLVSPVTHAASITFQGAKCCAVKCYLIVNFTLLYIIWQGA